MRSRLSVTGAMLAVLSLPVFGVHAQELRSASRGLTIGGGLLGSSISTNISETTVSESGGGLNLEVGYGFSPKLSIFLAGYGSTIDADPEYTLSQVDLGIRYMFRDTDKQARPYLEGALAGRQFRADLVDDEDAVTIKASSGGVSVGGGVQIFFSPRFALDLGLNYSVGTFSDWEANGVAFPFRDVDATSTNVRVGVRFWPQGN